MCVFPTVITATVRLCEGGGEPGVETQVFATAPSGLGEMAGWLSGHGVGAAVMEGTGVYWVAPFEALERVGIEAILVHAQQVKQLKGRKTDVADSVWLACVCQFGLCTPSHVPPQPFRELRSLSRQRRILVRQRVQKLIDRARVRLNGILSNVFGETAAPSSTGWRPAPSVRSCWPRSPVTWRTSWRHSARRCA